MFRQSISAMVLLAAGVQAATIHVPGDLPTIQAGIDAASKGDVVEVAPGTFGEKLNFHGKAIEVRGAGPGLSIVDPRLGSSGKARVVTFSEQEKSSSVLSGFTLTQGYIGVFGNGTGGGIFCFGSSPTITDCAISNNRAGQGAGIACVRASPRISNCTISGNHNGSGIDCHDGSSPRISNCTIDNHRSAHGAGIGSYHSSPTISNCTITSNTADLSGGGIYCLNSLTTIRHCIITNNSASEFGGGGVDITEQWRGASSVKIFNCTVANNDGGDGDKSGGILDSTDGTNIINSIIFDNTPHQIEGDPTVSFSSVEGETRWPGNGNVNADPRFRTYRNFDYVLGPASPCIDAGTGNDDGIDWGSIHPAYGDINSARPDMGAYGGPGASSWLR